MGSKNKLPRSIDPSLQ
jgi:hypothetical protein